VSLQARVLAEHRAVQGVRRLGEGLGFYKLKRKIERLLLQECTESKTQITRGYLKIFRKECVQGPFWKP
jgi:hypothetical protein